MIRPGLTKTNYHLPLIVQLNNLQTYTYLLIGKILGCQLANWMAMACISPWICAENATRNARNIGGRDPPHTT